MVTESIGVPGRKSLIFGWGCIRGPRREIFDFGMGLSSIPFALSRQTGTLPSVHFTTSNGQPSFQEEDLMFTFAQFALVER